MPLVSCQECKADIDSTDRACPQCGATAKRRSGLVAGILGGLVLAGILFLVLHRAPETPPSRTPDQIAAEKAGDTLGDADLYFASRIRAAIKNPDSFKLVKMLRNADGARCVLYRATNSAGVTVTESVRISEGGKTTNGANCTGFGGRDVTAMVETGLRYQ
jgi:hypothetical protein